MQNYLEGFELHWKSVRASVSSAMIRACDSQGRLSVAVVESAWKREKNYWSIPGKPHQCWLKDFREKSPAQAGDFEKMLAEFSFKEIPVPPKNLALAGVGCGVSLAAALMLYRLSPALLPWVFAGHTFLRILLFIVILFAGSVCSIRPVNKRHAAKMKNAMDGYLRQLEDLHKTLAGIIKNAELSK